MRAAYYERTGLAAEVLTIAELSDPHAGPGEVRVRLQWSGINPSDVKSRSGARTSRMPFLRVIPHSDGMGVIDEVGGGVSPSRLGERGGSGTPRGAGLTEPPRSSWCFRRSRPCRFPMLPVMKREHASTSRR